MTNSRNFFNLCDLFDDVLIHIISFITERKEYDKLRLVCKRLNKILLSKVCLKTFIDRNYGLDLNQNYESLKRLYYLALKGKSEINAACGFYKTFENFRFSSTTLRHLDWIDNLMYLALIYERKKTFSLLSKNFFDKKSFPKDDVVLTFMNYLEKNNSFMIETFFEMECDWFRSLKNFDSWFKYAQILVFSRYLNQFNQTEISEHLISLSAHEKRFVIDCEQKLDLLFQFIDHSMNDKQLNSLLFKLNHHIVILSDKLIDFALSYPIDRLINCQEFTKFLLTFKLFDLFDHLKDRLKPVDITYLRYLVSSNQKQEVKMLLQLNNLNFNESDLLKSIRNSFNSHLDNYYWQKLFCDYLIKSSNFDNSFNPLSRLCTETISIIKIWCHPKYIIHFIKNEKAYQIYSDYQFVKLVSCFTNSIKSLPTDERNQLVNEMFFSMGWHQKQLKMTLSISKTFHIISKWYDKNDKHFQNIKNHLNFFIPFKKW